MTGEKTLAPTPLSNIFSSGTPESCHSEKIDFEGLGIPEYAGRFAVLIHDLLSPTECEALLNAAEQTQGCQWEEAMVNVGGGAQRLMTDVRLCGRIIWDTPEIVGVLLERIKPHLPPEIQTVRNCPYITGPGPVKRKETYQMTRLNERLRFLKYTSGMYFREHCDGSYITPDKSEISFVTVHIYLNSQARESSEGSDNVQDDTRPLKGGATRFFGAEGEHYDVNPATGACLVFQHRGLFHSGEEVEQGTKYTIRTDLMYRKERS